MQTKESLKKEKNPSQNTSALAAREQRRDDSEDETRITGRF